MPIDISQLIATHAGQSNEIYERNVNARLAKALRIIGFDRTYVKAKGAYLWDEKGRKYLDMLAGYGVFNIGRNHDSVRKVLIDFMENEYASLVQMETPLLCGLLAEALKARAGYALEKVYFCSTGAEGNETAIKFSRRATGRTRIIYASSAFHGLTSGALALNGSAVFREKFGPLLDSVKVPFGDLAALEAELRRGDIAAFFVEPIQGKGVNIPPAGYMAAASRLCRAHGALFVADEVQTGIGRTGRFLALHHEEGVTPDMIVLSKALSGGFVPVGAVLMTQRIHDAVFSSLDQAVVHSSTFGKSNFAMAAGLATLAVLDDEKLTANAEAMGNLLGTELQKLQARFEFIKEVRWRGLMLAIEFHKPKSLKLRTAWTTAHALNPDLFCQAITMPLLQDHGILTQVAGNRMTTIKLIPPLLINADDVKWFVSAFEKVMTDLHKFPGPAWDSLMRIARNALGQRDDKVEQTTGP